MYRRLQFIEVKLQSLKDQTLNTGIETVDLIEGEIFQAKFKSQQVVDALIGIGVLKNVSPSVNISKNIPVVRFQSVITKLLDSKGNELPLSSPDNSEKADLSAFSMKEHNDFKS